MATPATTSEKLNFKATSLSRTVMNKAKIKKYKFKGKIWKYKGPSSWHFFTLPKKLSRVIRKNHGSAEEGWGRLRVEACINKTEWQTAIWYDTKFRSYLLPVKAAVRKREDIEIGVSTIVSLEIELEDFRAFF